MEPDSVVGKEGEISSAPEASATSGNNQVGEHFISMSTILQQNQHSVD